jgi:hypothetical protein
VAKKESTFEARCFEANPLLKEAARAALELKGVGVGRGFAPDSPNGEIRPQARMAEAGFKRVNVDGEELYRVEGDMLLDRDQLSFYVLQKSLDTSSSLSLPQAGLVGISEGGTLVRWKPGLVLAYTVLRNTFVLGGEDGYHRVVSCMKQATIDWERSCGIKFLYRADVDSSSTTSPSGVLFTVREFNSGGEFIAAAFFPNDPIHRRRMLIDPSFFGLMPPPAGFSQTGVLRHELGHVLGFRHEHIRSGAPAVCPDEPLFGTVDLTDYDPQSVMHYFCGGVGSRLLAITDLDRIGAQRLYGPPLSTVKFVG